MRQHGTHQQWDQKAMSRTHARPIKHAKGAPGDDNQLPESITNANTQELVPCAHTCKVLEELIPQTHTHKQGPGRTHAIEGAGNLLKPNHI